MFVWKFSQNLTLKWHAEHANFPIRQAYDGKEKNVEYTVHYTQYCIT